MKKSEFDAILTDLLTRTTLDHRLIPPQPPAPSTFQAVHADLVALRRIAEDKLEGKNPKRLQVRHRACNQALKFVRNEQDPVLSTYRCPSYNCTEHVSGPWGTSISFREWRALDLEKMSLNELQNTFYTFLAEDESDLKEWPLKMVDFNDGTRVYGTTRRATTEELLTKRVQALADIRDLKYTW